MDQPYINRFIRRLTSRPVIITDRKTGERKLADHVAAALSKCKNKVKALDKCLEYLEKRESDLRIMVPWNSWEIVQKDPKQVGTLACLKFMQQKISQIKALIVLDEIFADK